MVQDATMSTRLLEDITVQPGTLLPWCTTCITRGALVPMFNITCTHVGNRFANPECGIVQRAIKVLCVEEHRI